MKLAVYDAVGCFNDGRKSSLELFKHVGISPGCSATNLSSILNSRRQKRASYRWEEKTKKRRKVLRPLKKRKSDKAKNRKGPPTNQEGFNFSTVIVYLRLSIKFYVYCILIKHLSN